LGMQGEQVCPAMKGGKGDFRGVQVRLSVGHVPICDQGQEHVGEPEHG
jgi:hypothetical protein